MEYDFEEDISDTVALKGKIDRIDICRDGDKSYLRIIDYKTGKTVFDIKIFTTAIICRWLYMPLPQK